MKKMDLINSIKPEFFVIVYEPNYKRMVPYNVIPYFIYEYEQTKKGKPKTLSEFKKFIEAKSQYRFWSRCQYEIIISDWPCQIATEKWDVHNQIMMNIDLITAILYNAVRFKKKFEKSNDTDSIQTE